MRTTRARLPLLALARWRCTAARRRGRSARPPAAAEPDGRKDEPRATTSADDSDARGARCRRSWSRRSHEKEEEVTARAARRSACSRTTCATARTSQRAGRGAVQAGRAVLGRVEGRLPREDGRYQAAVTACHEDRGDLPAACRASRRPSICRRRRRSTTASSTSTRASARSTPSSTCTRSRCATRASSASRSSTSRPSSTVPALALHRRRLDGDRRVPVLRAAELQELAGGVREGAASTRSRSSTTWRCSRPPGATGSWATPTSRRCASRTCSIWPRRRRARPRQRAEARRRAAGPGARLPGRAVHRGRHQERAGRLRVPGADRRQGVLAARCCKQLADTVFDQTRYERAVEAYRLLIELDPNGAEAPDYHGEIVECVPAAGRRQERRRRDAQAGRQLRRRAAPGPRPTRIAPRPSSTRARMAEELIRNLAKTHARRGAGRTRRPPRWSTRTATRAPPRRTSSTWRNFPDAADAVELRYLRADILYFKLGKLEEAGRRVPRRRQDAAGRQVPQGRAAAGDGRVREGAQAADSGAGKREITESDSKFGEAVDLYATLFPTDKEIVTVIFKNGQFFFDYGEYDEAIKRFGLIVEVPRRSERRRPPATASCRRSTRPRTTRTSRPGRGG